MAVTGHRRKAACSLLLLAVCLRGSSAPVLADRAAAVRSQLSRVANALSAGNPAEAIAPFSKQFPDYDQLRDYFSGLTAAFSIANEIEVTDEDDGPAESLVTLHWAITLTSAGSGLSNQRSAEIHVRFVRERNQWKITAFSPIAPFDPSDTQQRENPGR